MVPTVPPCSNLHVLYAIDAILILNIIFMVYPVSSACGATSMGKLKKLLKQQQKQLVDHKSAICYNVCIVNHKETK